MDSRGRLSNMRPNGCNTHRIMAFQELVSTGACQIWFYMYVCVHIYHHSICFNYSFSFFQSKAFTAVFQYDSATHRTSDRMETEVKLLKNFNLTIRVHDSIRNVTYTERINICSCHISLAPQKVAEIASGGGVRSILSGSHCLQTRMSSCSLLRHDKRRTGFGI